MTAPEDRRESRKGEDKPGRVADLEETRIRASYWMNEARHKQAEGRGEPLMLAAEAVNAWKNAAYTMADQRDALRSATGASDDVRRVAQDLLDFMGKVVGTDDSAQVEIKATDIGAEGITQRLNALRKALADAEHEDIEREHFGDSVKRTGIYARIESAPEPSKG